METKNVKNLAALLERFLSSPGKDSAGTKKKKISTKYQTIEIIKANGTPLGLYSDSKQLDDSFQYCDGVQVIEITDGGVDYYSVGVEDKRDVYSPIVHKADYISGDAVPVNYRYKDIFIPIVRGEKIDIKTQLPANAAAEVKYLMIFRLRKEVDA